MIMRYRPINSILRLTLTLTYMLRSVNMIILNECDDDDDDDEIIHSTVFGFIVVRCC